MESRKSILVTGVAGFIGFHLVKLLSNSHKVTGLDNLNDYYNTDLKIERLNQFGIKYDKKSSYFRSHYYSLEFFKLDLNDKELLTDLFRKKNFDIVIHLAAQAGVRYSFENPEAFINSNIKGFFNIIDISQKFKIKRFIYASSSSVYGNSTDIPFKEISLTDRQESLYAVTKKSNELMAYSFGQNYGLETIGLRFFTVYGPYGRPDMSYFKFLNCHNNGKSIDVYNHGEMYRDFTYVDDIVNGIVNVSLNEPRVNKVISRIYNIGCGNPIKLIDFINLIENISGITFEKRYVDIQKGEVKSTHADVSKIILDYPNYKIGTQIDIGLKKFIDWYKNYILK